MLAAAGPLSTAHTPGAQPQKQHPNSAHQQPLSHFIVEAANYEIISRRTLILMICITQVATDFLSLKASCGPENVFHILWLRSYLNGQHCEYARLLFQRGQRSNISKGAFEWKIKTWRMCI
jgi:hypothetical protein